VAVALAVAFAFPLAGRPDPVTPPGSPATGAPPVDRLPAAPPGRYDVRLPRSVGDLGAAAPLTAGSIARADALFEPEAGESEGPAPVYAMFDGVLYRLDVALDWTTDPLKRISPPLRPASLSPDGRLAAFPQQDALVVVDLRTGRPASFKIPGSNLDVVWPDARTVLVGQAGATFAVDIVNGQVTPAAGRFVMADTAAGAPLLELPVDIGSGLTLREWLPSEAAPRHVIPVDQSQVAPYVVTGWSGPASRSGGVVARVGTARSSTGAAVPVVAAVDRNGVMARLLVLDGHRTGCCAVVGWLDAHTVAVRMDRSTLVAWDVRDGRTGSLAPSLPGTVAFSRGY
jgi:hypothetical protein